MRHVVVERCFAYAAQIPASRVAPFLVPLLVFFSLFIGLCGFAIFPVFGLVVLPLLIGSLSIIPVAVGSDRIRLRRAIAIYGDNYRLPICARCNYDLRGSDSDACPECGAPTRLRADEWR